MGRYCTDCGAEFGDDHEPECDMAGIVDDDDCIDTSLYMTEYEVMHQLQPELQECYRKLKDATVYLGMLVGGGSARALTEQEEQVRDGLDRSRRAMYGALVRTARLVGKRPRQRTVTRMDCGGVHA